MRCCVRNETFGLSEAHRAQTRTTLRHCPDCFERASVIKPEEYWDFVKTELGNPITDLHFRDMATRKSRPVKPETLAKEAEVLKLRRGGLTWDLVGERVGLSAMGAHECLQARISSRSQGRR
jgi:hypothetical protein